jgi:hypothetical protein
VPRTSVPLSRKGILTREPVLDAAAPKNPNARPDPTPIHTNPARGPRVSRSGGRAHSYEVHTIQYSTTADHRNTASPVLGHGTDADRPLAVHQSAVVRRPGWMDPPRPWFRGRAAASCPLVPPPAIGDSGCAVASDEEQRRRRCDSSCCPGERWRCDAGGWGWGAPGCCGWHLAALYLLYVPARTHGNRSTAAVPSTQGGGGILDADATEGGMMGR